MMRVYEALKARIMAGAFAPGERLDPAQLAPDLGASRTPVRDALIRLSAERLLDSLQHEGFRQPHISEPAIRDLYQWSNEVLHVILRSPGRKVLAKTSHIPPVAEDYLEATTSCFVRISELSANIEHRLVVLGINDRSATLRLAEARVLGLPIRDILAIETAFQSQDHAEIGRAIDQFHRRRLRVVADIASALRSLPLPEG